MNKYEVTRSHVQHNGDGAPDERVKEVLTFEADSFEVLATEYMVVLMFKNLYGDAVGAVEGFDYVKIVEEPEEPEPLEKVDIFLAGTDLGRPRVRPVEPDTMVA